MEMESENGEKINLKPDIPTVLGRGSGLHADDRTVSRRHISLEFHSNYHKADQDSKARVSFEVVGKNPVWVRSGESGEIRVYRKGETAELRSGDAFSIYGKKHVWFRLRSGVVGREEDDEDIKDDSDLEFEDVDVSGIDPAKEFGFIIRGHEFDTYGKKMIHDVKKWNWFLEEPKKESDDEDAVEQKSSERRRKRKKRKRDNQVDDDDDEWEGESEEDKELISKTKKIPTPAYSTRSKDHRKLNKMITKGYGQSEAQEPRTAYVEEMDHAEDNEDDETLGGFIVDDEEVTEDAGDVDDEEDFEDDEEDDLE